MKTLKRAIVTTSLSALIFLAFSFAEPIKPKVVQGGYIPGNGCVPDKETALKIAEAIWLPIYGKSVLNEKPYTVDLENGIWSVTGTLKEGYDGGVAHIQIQKIDCKITEVFHTK